MYILMDVEGTTTSVAFVFETLFPYARKNLESFIKKNRSKESIEIIMGKVRQTIRAESKREGTDSECIKELLKWISDDRKHPALKELQGHIWEHGYQSGEIKGHIYPDAHQNMMKWYEQGHRLGIYSSGSVKAQRLLFTHTEQGDLSRIFNHHFDTSVGQKRETDSYAKILAELELPADQVLFLSDIDQELDAAKEVGLQTTHLARGIPASKHHKSVQSFDEISPKL